MPNNTFMLGQPESSDGKPVQVLVNGQPAQPGDEIRLTPQFTNEGSGTYHDLEVEPRWITTNK